MAKKLDEKAADVLRALHAADFQIGPPIPEGVEYMKEKRLDDYGREVVSGIPMAPPVGYKRQPSMVEIVRDMVRSERLKHEAEMLGVETFEEADDFDVGDEEDDPTGRSTPYENEFDPPIREMVAEGAKSVADKKKAAKAAPPSPAPAPVPAGPPAPAPDPSKGSPTS